MWRLVAVTNYGWLIAVAPSFLRISIHTWRSLTPPCVVGEIPACAFYLEIV